MRTLDNVGWTLFFFAIFIQRDTKKWYQQSYVRVNRNSFGLVKLDWQHGVTSSSSSYSSGFCKHAEEQLGKSD
ncbi:hypothetical protein M0802_000759 [Mischocyttarus mexicanus]|nr:hypothetical protein M0802_000759 [Mischocyttarus mexicanus]